jgi:hypothetical protein
MEPSLPTIPPQTISQRVEPSHSQVFVPSNPTQNISQRVEPSHSQVSIPSLYQNNTLTKQNFAPNHSTSVNMSPEAINNTAMLKQSLANNAVAISASGVQQSSSFSSLASNPHLVIGPHMPIVPGDEERRMEPASTETSLKADLLVGAVDSTASGSDIDWKLKNPQDWTPQDVVDWLRHNSISKPTIESFRGKYNI